MSPLPDLPPTRFETAVTRLLAAVARASGGMLLLLIAIIMFDIVTRRFLVLGSTQMQEFEWHLHGAILLLVLGYAYLSDGHVRINVLHDRFGTQGKAWVEIVGSLVFMLPFTLVVIYYGVDFAWSSFLQNESSASPTGLPYRWIIKALIPVGIGLLLLASVVVFLRNLRILRRGRSGG